MAVANYHSAYGRYPPAYIADANGKPMHSWRVLILPFIEQKSLWDQYDLSQSWNSEINSRLAKQMPSVFSFHGEYEPGAVTTNYLAVVGEDTLWPMGASRSTDEVTDQRSSTIMIVENTGQQVHWMEPRDLGFQTMDFQINSPDGLSSHYISPAVVMLDGSVRQMEADLPEDVFRALLTVDGGEDVEDQGDTWRMLRDGRLRSRSK